MKGVVMSLKDTSAVILTDDGLFIHAKNQKYHVGQTVVLAEAKKTNHRLVTWLAAAAAAIAIIVGGGFAYYTPVTYVSVDVNPSIYYSLNMFDRVLDVEPVNEDAKAILKDLNLKNEPITKAVEQTIGRLIEKGYISNDDNGGVVIATSNSVNSAAEVLADKLQDDAQEYINDKGKTAVVDAQAVGRDLVEQANKLGVTPGKLNLVKKLKASAADPDTINVDEWLKKSVKDINKAIKENRKASGGSSTSTTIQNNTGASNSSTSDETKKTHPSAAGGNNSGNKNNGTKEKGKPTDVQSQANEQANGNITASKKNQAYTKKIENIRNTETAKEYGTGAAARNTTDYKGTK